MSIFMKLLTSLMLQEVILRVEAVPQSYLDTNNPFLDCSEDLKCPDVSSKCAVPLVFSRVHCCGLCPETDATVVSILQNVKLSHDFIAHALLKRSPSSTVPSIASSIVPSAKYPIPAIGTKGPTPTPCPDGCHFEGKYYCQPIECHVSCVNGVKLPDNCCAECQDGRQFMFLCQ